MNDLILTLLTILVSLVAMTVSIAQAAITQDIAKNSNKIADKALEVSERALNVAHIAVKDKIEPELSIVAVVGSFQPLDFWFVQLEFHNFTKFKATITQIRFSGNRIESYIYRGFTIKNGEVITKSISFELIHNEMQIIQLKFNPAVINMQFKGESDKLFKDQFDFRKAIFEHVYWTKLKVFYHDEVGTKYTFDAYFDREISRYRGITKEFSQDDLD